MSPLFSAWLTGTCTAVAPTWIRGILALGVAIVVLAALFSPAFFPALNRPRWRPLAIVGALVIVIITPLAVLAILHVAAECVGLSDLSA